MLNSTDFCKMWREAKNDQERFEAVLQDYIGRGQFLEPIDWLIAYRAAGRHGAADKLEADLISGQALEISERIA